MKSSLLGKAGVFIAGLFLLLSPAICAAEYGQATPGAPPIEQPLVREGTLALKLAPALGLPTAGSEAEAESLLGERGILPRNGWIADYPATPDIIGELRKAVGDAADAGKIPLSKAEALKRFETVTANLAIDIRPQDEDGVITTGDEEDYLVSPTEINDYYYGVGPPVVTYYTPPYDFYYLYSWVPYPFWCGGFWFSGFFVLNDFHRSVFIGRNHHRAFVSNHFHSGRGISRIDPVARFNGQSGFSGHRWSHGRSDVGMATAGRRNPASAGVQGNTRSNFTSPTTRTTWGGNRQYGNWRSSPRARGDSVTYAPFSRGDRPAARNYTYSRGYAPSRVNNFPVRNSSSPVRVYTPTHGNVTYRGNNSPSRGHTGYTPSVNSSVPAGGTGASRGFARSGGHMPSFNGNAMSGSSFRGGGSFSGGHGRR